MRLLPEQPFEHPLRWGKGHYVPILKSMPGEFNALIHASPTTWDRLTPLIEATGQAGVEQAPRASRFRGLPGRLARAIGAERPFLLDFPWLDSRALINVGKPGARTPVNVIEYVFEECRRLGLTVIPVLRPDHDQGRQALIRATMERDGRGVCIRVPIASRFWGQGFGHAIEGLCANLGVERDQADLLLDLAYIPTPPGFAAEHVARLLTSIPHIEEWRSLILAGTVVPSTAAGWPEGGITRVPRHEQSLYEELVRSTLVRRPTFADYAIQHPEPPAEGGPGMRANIRYTIDGFLLYVRGHSILEHDAQQYQQLCSMLVQHPEFSGSTYSWGDQIIADTATGKLPPKSEPQWRGAGTSHHLRLVAEWTGRS
jgi:hypothetical protein